MALLFIKQSLTALHGSKNIRSSSFTIEVTIEGNLSKGFVAGIDHSLLQTELSNTLKDLEGHYLDDVVGRATNEHIAAFIYFSLNQFSVRSVKVADSDCTAAEVFSEDIKVKDYPAQLLFEKAKSLLFRGKAQIAVKRLDEAICLMPEFAEAHNLKGRCFKELRQHDLALREFAKAILIKPDYGEAYRNIGNAHLFLNQHELMIPAFTKAISLMENNPVAYNNRGFAYQQMGKYELAVADHTTALKLEPCYAEAYSDRALAYSALGKIELSEQDRKKAECLIVNKNDVYSLEKREPY